MLNIRKKIIFSFISSLMILSFLACSSTESSIPKVVFVTKEVSVEKVVEKVPATLLPSFEILNKHPKLDCLNKTMDVFIDIFGIWIISTKSAPENYVLHTANVLAEFIDNDLDGIPDDCDPDDDGDGLLDIDDCEPLNQYICCVDVDVDT